jgi:hypothetical protein
MTFAETAPLQLILPTDKRNPSFSLYLTADCRTPVTRRGRRQLDSVATMAGF